uniref:F-box domain-containing protein n=1 Tax=Leersia perrieri TaxID=77586 RepID=A0A0D9WJX7_9ORYZ
MEEESRNWDELPAYVLYEITSHLPCNADRVRTRVVSKSWRSSLRHLEAPPLPPQLPWLLRPSAVGPTFCCLISGADEHSVHRLRVPGDDLRAARYFGSYDGGWLFLAFGRHFGHTIVNLRTGARFRLPDIIPRPMGLDDFPMIMLAATLSSPPSDRAEDRCFGAAIIHSSPFITDSRDIAFWRMGDFRTTSIIPADEPFDVVSGKFVKEEMEDVIYYNEAFYFLSKLRNILVCRPALQQGDHLRVHDEWMRFVPQDDLGYYRYHRPVSIARYLVESRGQLLMVLKGKCSVPGLPQLLFSVFRITHDPQAPAGAPPFSWTMMPALDGRMLFVGHGCSRSYELAVFPGFKEGIYFLDDLQFYDVRRIIQYQEYLCFDNGKYTWGMPPYISRCFWPDQVMSNYSSPVWLLPGGEDTGNNAEAQIDAPLPALDRLTALPDDILPLINDRIPCLVHRRRLARVCTALRNFFNPQHDAAPPAPLPWILLPRPAGPSFSCVLRGCATHELDLDVPADARAARCFGAYEGGWVFLAVGQTGFHVLVNLRTHHRVYLPDIAHYGITRRRCYMGITMLAAALSSQPEKEHCVVVVAAICSMMRGVEARGPYLRAFWRLGNVAPVELDSEEDTDAAMPYLEDVIHHDGVFYFLTDEEDLLMFAPVVHEDGELEIESMGTRRFLHEERQYDGEATARARYLVESLGQLLMVVRITPRQGQAQIDAELMTSAFRVFQMVQAEAPAPINDNAGGENDKIADADAQYTWNELHEMGGQMLFVGRGCSRSYNVANYPGFRPGVYFLDDERIYGEETMFEHRYTRQYPCRDIGKWLSSEPIPSIDNFLPEQGPSSYSPPAWFLN